MKVKRMVTKDVFSFKVGDIIKFKMTNGEKVEAMAVQQEDDNMIFCMVDCLKELYSMNTVSTNNGGYEASDLRTDLNTGILNRFPIKLRDVMVRFNNGDFLRIPTEMEICGEYYHGEYENPSVTRWKPMKLRKNRIALRGKNGDPQCSYWLWNRDRYSPTGFSAANCGGTSYCDNAYYDLGVRPVFKLRNITKEEKEVQTIESL